MMFLLAQNTDFWKQAGEFGVLAFLLILVLVGVGWALWKLGSKLTDATADSMKRQADAGEKTAEAVVKIGDLTAAMQVQNQAFHQELELLRRNFESMRKANIHVIDAIGQMSPEQNERVRGYLEEARRRLQGS